MDPESAIQDHIEPTLLEVFDRSQTRGLLAMATLAYVTAAGDKAQRYGAFVESICSDRRSMEKWGEAGAATQAAEWIALLSPES